MTTALTVFALVSFAAALLLLRERFRLTGERDLARARLKDHEEGGTHFESVANRVLKSSNEEFLRLAKEVLATRETKAISEIDKRRLAIDELVQPIRDALSKTSDEIKKVERGHLGLSQQVTQMQAANTALREETGKLSQALRKPNVRGRYGEIQLERVVELAGMRAYCDFTLQENLRDEHGKLSKPDLVVRLPNERIIAVDAKTSIDSYLDALDAKTDEEQRTLLARYAENVVQQAQKLNRREYWKHFDSSPEFVVMFIPGDQLIDAALEQRPDLLDLAAQWNIVIASPSTLIGLLRAVHVGWREKNLSDSAQELFQLGRELHERAAIALGHAAKVGDSLNQARASYNKFVSSVDARLVPTLRKFEERGASSTKTLEEPRQIEGEANDLRALGHDATSADVDAETESDARLPETTAKAERAPEDRVREAATSDELASEDEPSGEKRVELRPTSWARKGDTEKDANSDTEGSLPFTGS